MPNWVSIQLTRRFCQVIQGMWLKVDLFHIVATWMTSKSQTAMPDTTRLGLVVKQQQVAQDLPFSVLPAEYRGRKVTIRRSTNYQVRPSFLRHPI